MAKCSCARTEDVAKWRSSMWGLPVMHLKHIGDNENIDPGEVESLLRNTGSKPLSLRSCRPGENGLTTI